MENENWNTTEPDDDGGDVGGDWQVGPARNVRWWRALNPDEQFAPGFEVVDLNIYIESADAVGGGDPTTYIVTDQECVVICSDKDDPGGTEKFSDYFYDHSAYSYSLDAAERERDRSFAYESNNSTPYGV